MEQRPRPSRVQILPGLRSGRLSERRYAAFASLPHEILQHRDAVRDPLELLCGDDVGSRVSRFHVSVAQQRIAAFLKSVLAWPDGLEARLKLLSHVTQSVQVVGFGRLCRSADYADEDGSRPATCALGRSASGIVSGRLHRRLATRNADPDNRSMRDNVDHLPSIQQRELARVRQTLMGEFEAAIAGATQPWKKNGKIQKIVLFGRYSRDDWVDEAANGYQSDFDILVIVSHKDLTDVAEYWYVAEDKIQRDEGIARP